MCVCVCFCVCERGREWGLLGPASRARTKKTPTRSVIMKKEEEVTLHSPVYTQGLLVIEGTQRLKVLPQG